ncbi:mercuric transporter MerH [Mycobacterium kiyosense]|uniref:MerC domain-containing protein n=1 Tax=Mycobacterium kiyosense TaxID=2871094 RepID=UPI0021736ED0|nr:MerC domain-containing protein [Mycobacterium kiyosense]GLD45107.1 mercuric transporter MerH [Mycobacterium kiyosense]
MSVSPTPDTGHAAAVLPPRWQRWLPRGAALVAAFATLCCLGLTALVSLLTAIGATFLTTDATLRPLLAVSLVITIAASAFTWRRHRNPLPLLLTVIAAGVIFWSLYGAQLSSAGLPGGVGVWLGLALLLTAQVWDVWRLRQLKRQNAYAA